MTEIKAKYLPIDDGVSHINVYSKGRTELGRYLSNFAHFPFHHPVYGEFASLEAFYFWLSTGRCQEHLRSLYGFEARKAGKAIPSVHCENFQAEIARAIGYKIRQHKSLAHALKECKLPLAHYYWFGSLTNCKVQELPEHDYMVEALEQIRDELQKENS